MIRVGRDYGRRPGRNFRFTQPSPAKTQLSARAGKVMDIPRPAPRVGANWVATQTKKAANVKNSPRSRAALGDVFMIPLLRCQLSPLHRRFQLRLDVT